MGLWHIMGRLPLTQARWEVSSSPVSRSLLSPSLCQVPRVTVSSGHAGQCPECHGRSSGRRGAAGLEQPGLAVLRCPHWQILRPAWPPAQDAFLMTGLRRLLPKASCLTPIRVP